MAAKSIWDTSVNWQKPAADESGRRPRPARKSDKLPRPPSARKNSNTVHPAAPTKQSTESTDKALADKALAENTPTENTPTERTPTENTPTENTPTERTPTDRVPTALTDSGSTQTRRDSVPPMHLRPSLIRLQTILMDTARQGRDGELVLRKGERVGRVYFVGGRVAWAQAEGRRGVFISRLVRRHGIPQELLADVIQDCQRKGANLGQYLVERGILTEEELRRTLRAHLIAQMESVLNARGRLDALFLPGKRVYHGDEPFPIEELLSPIALGEALGQREIQADQLWARVQEEVDSPLAIAVMDVKAGTRMVRNQWGLTPEQDIAIDLVITSHELGQGQPTDLAEGGRENLIWDKNLIVYGRRGTVLSILVFAERGANLGRFIQTAGKAVSRASKLTFDE